MDAKRESVLFHYEVGRAITQWANVEAGIASVLVICLRDDGEKPSGPNAQRIQSVVAGYEAIDSFRSKVSFANAVFRNSRLGFSHGHEFADLLKTAEKRSSKRNHMAHWQASHIVSATKPGRRVLLQPRPSKQTTILERLGSGMGLRDIAMARLEFFDSYMRLQQFAVRFYPKDPLSASPATYAGLPQKAPTLAQLEAEFWKETGHRR
jgi:hypothetical protein